MLPEKGSASEGSAAFSGDLIYMSVCVLRGSRWLLHRVTVVQIEIKLEGSS